MRHFFGYAADGELLTVETYGPGGFPETHAMDDPACVQASVVSLRERRALSDPDLIGWALYDCPCPGDAPGALRNCGCFNQFFHSRTFDPESKSFSEKPARTVVVNDVTIGQVDMVTAEPNATVVFKVTSDVPDGTTVECVQKGSVDLSLENEWVMTFTGGETEVKNLIAPAQGVRGVVSISGKNFRGISFCVRGFATT